MSHKIKRGTVYSLWHPGRRLFSGYGLTVEPGRTDLLVGLLMIDRPLPVDPAWLGLVSIMFGHVELYQMTHDGDQGLACQMFIGEDSRAFVRPVRLPDAEAFQAVLMPFLDQLPNPRLELSWDRQRKLWRSRFRLDPEGVVPGQPRFHLGEIVATPGAAAALLEANQSPATLLHRHVTGDWGTLPEEDIAENELSVRKGFRILSRYVLSSEETLYVITEHDRSVTTLLLPSEY